jgi:hypothetical protein
MTFSAQMSRFFRDNDMRALFDCILRVNGECEMMETFAGLVEQLDNPILTEVSLSLGFKLTTPNCKDNGTACSICLEPVTDHFYDIPACGHRFHRSCLVQFWLTHTFQTTNFFGDIFARLPPSGSFSCPNCRSTTVVHFFSGKKKEDHHVI